MTRSDLSLPEDIEDMVLLFADSISLLQARAVCRRWKNLIDKKEFAEKHARLQIIRSDPLVLECFEETSFVPDLNRGTLTKIRQHSACCYNPFATAPNLHKLLWYKPPDEELAPQCDWIPFASALGLVFMATQPGSNLLLAVYNPLKRDSSVLLPSPGNDLIPGTTVSIASMTCSAEDLSYTIYMSLNRKLYIFSSATWSWRVLDFLSALGWENWSEACCNMLLDEKASMVWVIGANAATTSFGIISYNLASEELKVVHEWGEELEGEGFDRFLNRMGMRRALARNENSEIFILEEKSRVFVFRNNAVEEISPDPDSDSDSAAPGSVSEEFAGAAAMPTGVVCGSQHLWMDYYSCRDFVVDLKSSGWTCSSKLHCPPWLRKDNVSRKRAARSRDTHARPSKTFKRKVISYVPTMV